MSRCSECNASAAPECTDIPLGRDGIDALTYEPEYPEGGTRTAGAPIYSLTVTNPELPE